VSVFNLDKTTREQAKLDTIAVATINAIQNGAKPASIKTLNIEEVPLAYLPNTIKIKAKVVGEI
jgi:hypothetical protein